MKISRKYLLWAHKSFGGPGGKLRDAAKKGADRRKSVESGRVDLSELLENPYILRELRSVAELYANPGGVDVPGGYVRTARKILEETDPVKKD